ncbi:MAG: hypothetical protein ABFC73_13760, partial [Clostridiaceae bacterium]
MKKLLCIVLCLTLTSSLLFACASPAVTETTDTAATEAPASEAAATEELAATAAEPVTITILRPG